MYNGDFSNWVDSQGRLLVIYDPATTRPNPNGTGFIRDPFPGNRIPANRFSTVARQYLALAQIGGRARIAPGSCPARSATSSNNFLSPGGTTVETTHKFSVKIDHALSGAHRLAYLFNRTTNDAVPGRCRRGRPSRAVQHVPVIELRRRPSPRELGLDYRPAHGESPERRHEHLQQERVLAERRSELARQGSAFRMRSTATRTSASSPSPSFRRGADRPTTGRSSRGSRSRTTSRSARGRTRSRPASPSTASRRTASVSRISAAGPASASWKRRVPGATTLANGGGNSFASFLLGVADTGRTETIRYLQQVYPYYGFYAQDDWRHERQAGAQLRRCATSSRSRRAPAAISTRTSRRPSRIRPSTTIPARWCLPVTGPGARARAASSPATTAPWRRASASRTAPTTRRSSAAAWADRSDASRSTQSSSHFAGFIGQYVFASADAGVTPAFNLDQGLPAYPLPPLIDPTFSNNNDVDWFNGQAASRPAVYDNWTISVQREVRQGPDGGARLQRRRTDRTSRPGCSIPTRCRCRS